MTGDGARSNVHTKTNNKSTKRRWESSSSDVSVGPKANWVEFVPREWIGNNDQVVRTYTAVLLTR